MKSYLKSTRNHTAKHALNKSAENNLDIYSSRKESKVDEHAGPTAKRLVGPTS
jgi:hypothetical protein